MFSLILRLHYGWLNILFYQLLILHVRLLWIYFSLKGGYNMLQYFYSIYDKSSFFTYTVDMLRLSVHFDHRDAGDIISYLKYEKSKDIENLYWTHSKFGAFAHNFTIGHVYFGVGLNSGIDSNFILFTMEFNPNKCNDLDFDLIKFFLKRFNYVFRLTSCDIAIDVPYNINNLKFIDTNKRSFSVFYHDIDDKTFYLGKAPNRLKVYNKKIESNLDHEMTRFEVSKHFDNVYAKDLDFNFDFKFPSITFENFVTFEEDPTIKALQYALNNGYCFKDLSRTYKEKFKQNLKFTGKVDNSLCNLVLKDTIDIIFEH